MDRDGWMWMCLECSHVFSNADVADNGVAGWGCPRCGSTQMDAATDDIPAPTLQAIREAEDATAAYVAARN